MNQQLKIGQYSKALAALRKMLTDNNYAEIKYGSVDIQRSTPFTDQIRVWTGVSDGFLNRGSLLPHLQAAATLPKVYSLQTVYRNDPPDGRNHLPNFEYLQIVAPGGIEVAENLVSQIVIAISDALGLDRATWDKVCHRKHADACSFVGNSVQEDFSFEQQISIANEATGLTYVWDKPQSLEPLQFGVCRASERHHFEVFSRCAGELGSGFCIETDRPAAMSDFSRTSYRQKMMEGGFENIDDAAKPYFSSLDALDGEYFNVGLSFERLLQTVISEPNISNVVPFPNEAGLSVGPMP